MPRIVRLGDTSDHGGTVGSGSAVWDCEGEPVATVGDILQCPLHGPQPIVEGSSKWQCEGRPIARHGDHAACGAKLISGAVKWECA